MERANINIDIAAHLKEEIQAIANDRGQTLTAVVIEALWAYVRATKSAA